MYRPLLSFALLAAFVTPLVAQSNMNVTRLGRLDEHPEGYNDVWGYVAPDGREYALLGTQDGLSVINASNPLAPYEVAFFPTNNCLWHDIKSWGRYVYEATDCSSGVRVFDMLDPENPVLAGEFAQSTIDNAHNIQIDLGTGLLYTVGDGNGFTVWNLAIDPVNPPLVKVWSGGGNNYIHDLYVFNGKAHTARIYAGSYDIVNVANLPAVSTIGSAPSGANFTHSTWVNNAETTAVVVDETTGNRHLSFFDISDPSNPSLTSSYSEDITTSPHNPFITDDEICHVSWYSEGYIALDMSDPANPVKVGRFDTTPGAGAPISLFTGAWGCYPFQPSGFIYISDIQKGLYILQLNSACPTDPGGAPVLCKVWPENVSVLESPRHPVILTGNDMSDATSVTVGDVVLTPPQFTVKNQMLYFNMPLVSQLGPNAISVTTPSGTTSGMSINVTAPVGTPLLDSGPAQAADGSFLEVAVGSNPGDLHYIALAFSIGQSAVPGKVTFDIGSNFSDLFLQPLLVANGAGVSGLGVVVPAIAVGATVYWQAAVFDPNAGWPSPATNFTSTTFVP